MPDLFVGVSLLWGILPDDVMQGGTFAGPVSSDAA